MISRASLAGGLLAALVFAGCADLRPLEPAKPISATDRAFEVNGRFAVRYRDDGGSGRILWSHTPLTDDLTISSPLGQGIARIVRRDGVYTLTTSDNRTHSSRDPDQLTEPVLGWRLPLSGLPYWVRGREAPGMATQHNSGKPDAPSELRQAGWTIEYLSRSADHGLPERMRIRRDELDIRLVLEEWRALP